MRSVEYTMHLQRQTNTCIGTMTPTDIHNNSGHVTQSTSTVTHSRNNCTKRLSYLSHIPHVAVDALNCRMCTGITILLSSCPTVTHTGTPRVSVHRHNVAAHTSIAPNTTTSHIIGKHVRSSEASRVMLNDSTLSCHSIVHGCLRVSRRCL